MCSLRDDLIKARKEIPEIQGLSFFGSRTRGQERTDPDRPSDLDMFVFYDGSNYIQETTHPRTMLRAGAGGKMVIDGSAAARVQANRLEHEAVRERILSYYTEKFHQIGAPIDRVASDEGAEDLQSKTIGLINIAPQQIQEAICVFESEVMSQVAAGRRSSESTTNATWRLVALFSLAVGNAILRARKQVLDAWKISARGELYFRSLMQSLAYIERLSAAKRGRVMVEYQRYPQTIEEGERIFLATVDSTPSRKHP